jgi:3-oxoadipate enol-lactonase
MGEQALEPRAFEVLAGRQRLAAESVGEGPPVVLAHGLTATRRYVLHGSLALPRRGFHVVSYDARGHGDSDPGVETEAERGQASAYGYEQLAGDLEAVLDRGAGEGRVALVGHSMGTHTIARYALEHRDRVAAVVFAGPVSIGLEAPDDVLARWDALADGLERGGVDGFLAAQELQVDPEWRERIRRFSRARMLKHRHLDAVARALREVPRSVPFEGLAELEQLDLPALVVASHDVADPSHPYAVAAAWADALPRGRLVGEGEGEPPLAWRGGKLSREVASFLERPEVAERHRA